MWLVYLRLLYRFKSCFNFGVGSLPCRFSDILVRIAIAVSSGVSLDVLSLYRFRRRFYEIFIRVIILVSRRSQRRSVQRRRRRLCRSLLRPLRKFPFGYEYVLVDDLLFASRIVPKENTASQKSKSRAASKKPIKISKVRLHLSSFQQCG